MKPKNLPAILSLHFSALMFLIFNEARVDKADLVTYLLFLCASSSFIANKCLLSYLQVADNLTRIYTDKLTILLQTTRNAV